MMEIEEYLTLSRMLEGLLKWTAILLGSGGLGYAPGGHPCRRAHGSNQGPNAHEAMLECASAQKSFYDRI